MGNSYVQVYLDTTPPTAILSYPTLTTIDSIEYLTITANEELSINHEIVITDSLNTEHLYTFSLLNDKKTFVGNISFQDFPKGIATLKVRLFDKVMNRSGTIQGAINIIDPLDQEINGLKLNISDSQRINQVLTITTQKIILQEN